MATNYPGSLDTSTQQPSPSASTEMDDSGFEHDAVHTNHSGAIIALETKVGTGDSNAVADSVLAGTGSGTSGWSTAPSLAGLTVDTDTLHVDATNGRVGIGTTSPSQHLHVNSGNTNTTSVFESTDGTAYIGIKDNASSSDIHVAVGAIGNEMRLRAGNANRVTIDSGGDVGIGTTSPSFKLDVAGSGRFSADGGAILTLQDTGSTDTGGYISFTQSAGTRMGLIGYANNDDFYVKNDNSGGNMYFGVQAGYAFQVDTSRNLIPYADNTHSLGKSGRAWNHFYLHQGNTFSSGGYWTLRSRDSDRQVMEYVSSERFKKDIEDLPLSEAYQILDARVIKFRGIDDDDTVPLEAGLSAESLHNAGFEYAVRYDEGHWGETPRSVYYDMLTAPLIKICKDLHDRVTALEAA